MLSNVLEQELSRINSYKMIMKKARKEMAKKSGKKISKGLKHASARTDQIPTDEEKPFDFGGLPDRDLKKNLGCG